MSDALNDNNDIFIKSFSVGNRTCESNERVSHHHYWSYRYKIVTTLQMLRRQMTFSLWIIGLDSLWLFWVFRDPIMLHTFPFFAFAVWMLFISHCISLFAISLSSFWDPRSGFAQIIYICIYNDCNQFVFFSNYFSKQYFILLITILHLPQAQLYISGTIHISGELIIL